MSEATQILSKRLQDAVVSEVEYSGELIDLGVLPTFRALVLGAAQNYRFSFAPLSSIEDLDERARGACVILHSAMILTAAREFVLTAVNDDAVTFTTYGVSRTADAGLHVSLEKPFDFRSARGIRCSSEIADGFRKCIPPEPFVCELEWAPSLQKAFAPDGPFPLDPVGSLHPSFSASEGRA